MSTIKRTQFKLPSPGPYIARITSHLDVTFMGGIEAVLEEGTLTDPNQQKHVYQLRYLNPFYGAMSSDFEKANKNDFYDVQKSYGMTFVPPDVGTKVMVMFVGSDSNQGYWMGCVQDVYQNHMIPGIAASTNVAWANNAQKEKYDVDYIPVAEFHKKGLAFPYKPNEQLKPVHPFADRLLAQGLLADQIRGVTSSSARREFPSGVFGISTPGPLDPNSKKDKIGYTDTGSVTAPTSRFAGHQFVMDDGDVTGSNKLVRLRTGGGHQILLNDSGNCIYIANASGTAWLEFTGNGKIDIYAADSVSIHTENDFNFKADRDINLEASRNFNIKARQSMTVNVDRDYNLRAQDGKIFIDGNLDTFVKLDNNLTTKGTINFLSQTKTNITGKGDVSLFSQGAFIVSAAGKTKFGKPGDIAEPATAAIGDTIKLPEYLVPRVRVDAGWRGQRYQAGQIPSIMQRVPMHEPWYQHESYNPSSVLPNRTDSSRPSDSSTVVRPPGGSDPPPAQTTTITFSADAWFEFDKSVLLSAGEQALGQLAEQIKGAQGTFAITIIGHTDSKGSDQYNQALSQRRADSARVFLIGKGIPSSWITATGRGESQPVQPNEKPDGTDNPEGRAANRRVEIRVQQVAITVPPSAGNPADWVQDKTFIEAVKRIAPKHKMDYLDLLALMHFETAGQMSASTRGPGVAVGLIQFTPAGVRNLPVTLAQLGSMTRTQQMEYVDLYFARWANLVNKVSKVTLNDAYMLVFCPRAFGKPDTAPCYSDRLDIINGWGITSQEGIARERENYRANSWLDRTNPDGVITKAEACARLPQSLAKIKKALGL